MIIEFVGPPGTGKTTIAAALAVILSSRIRPTPSRMDLGFNAIRYIIGAPFRFMSLFCATVHENWRTPRLLRYKLILLAGALARTARAHREGRDKTVLLDEGLAQYALALPERELSPGEIRGYFLRHVRCDALVVMLADTGTRRARMNERGRIPRSRLGIDQKRWQALIELNASRIADVLGVEPRVIVISCDAAPEKIARTIAARLPGRDSA